jgi:putative ABC transport system permease protein
MNKQNVTLYIPKNKDELNNFVLLNDRVSSKEYTLSENGVIISEKLSKLLDVKKGDVITLNDEDNDSYDVVVDNIIESYVSHSMYMSKDYYEKIIGKDLIFNSQLISVDIDLEDEQIIAETLMECDKVINVTLTSKLETIATEAMDSLDIVIVILIISAGGLALVVLYNLNNINVSERIRELSTIKVLGFYDREVTMYILRENSILTIFGIFAGVFMGKILHIFVSKTAEQDNMMFSPNIYPRSFIYAIALTLLFSSIVMIMMHRKLKKIDMIDALKSNE